MPRKSKVVEIEPSKPEEPEELTPAIEEQSLTLEDKPQPDEIIVDFNHATRVSKIEKQQCNLRGMPLSAKTLKYSHDRNCKARKAAEKQPIPRNSQTNTRVPILCHERATASRQDEESNNRSNEKTKNCGYDS